MVKRIEKERWNKEEIRKAARIIAHAEKTKSFFVKVLDEIVHWFILLIILFGNILIAGFIVFVSGLLSNVYFYIIIILFALSFGFLIEVPLQDIEKLSKHKHFLSRIMLPVLALLNVYILFGVKYVIEYFLELKFEFNTLAVGLIYGVFFIFPHFFIWFVKKLK